MKIEQTTWSQRVVDELAKLGETATVNECSHAWEMQRIELESAVVLFSLGDPCVTFRRRWSFRIIGDPSTRYRDYYVRSVSTPDQLNAAEIAEVVVEVARRQRMEPRVKELNEQRGWAPDGILYFNVGRKGELMLTMEVPVTNEQADAMIAAAMACGITKAAGARA